MTMVSPKVICVASTMVMLPFAAASVTAVQVLLQAPQALAAVPSSQASVPATMPSPQTVSQVLGAPLQLQPDSTVQVEEQPSPDVVLPSSQVSVPSITPSPHF